MNGKDVIRLSAGLVAFAISLALLLPSKPRASNPEFSETLIDFQFEIERQQALKSQEEHKQRMAESQQKLRDQVKQSLPKVPEPELTPTPPAQQELPQAFPETPQEQVKPRHRGLFFRSRHLHDEESCPLP